MHSKVLLALAGVAMVVLSLLMAVGVAALCGVHATLIISEVIPFLVLAIGVDNIFLLVETYDNYDTGLPVHARMSLTLEKVLPPLCPIAPSLSQVGSSIMMASLSETFAFLLGTLTRMPAVVAFSIYAALAVFFDFLLQITCFAAFMALDRSALFPLLPLNHASARRDNKRVDCLPCIRLAPGPEDWSESSLLIPATSTAAADGSEPRPARGLIAMIFSEYYSPFLMHRATKGVVVVAFIALLFVGINFSVNVELGLPQTVRPCSFLLLLTPSRWRCPQTRTSSLTSTALQSTVDQGRQCTLSFARASTSPTELNRIRSIAFFIFFWSHWTDLLVWQVRRRLRRMRRELVAQRVPLVGPARQRDIHDGLTRGLPRHVLGLGGGRDGLLRHVSQWLAV